MLRGHLMGEPPTLLNLCRRTSFTRPDNPPQMMPGVRILKVTRVLDKGTMEELPFPRLNTATGP